MPRPGGAAALEITGELARQLRVPSSSNVLPLAAMADDYEEQFDRQTAQAPGLLSAAAIAQTHRTIRHLADESTKTITAIASFYEELQHRGDLRHRVGERIERFSAEADLNPDLALACCQARAASSYLYQHQVPGSCFDLEFLGVPAESP